MRSMDGGRGRKRAVGGFTGALVAVSLTVFAAACGPSDDGGGELRARLVFGEQGTQPGQINYPRAMDVDGDCVWVVDKAARVQRFDAETGRYRGGWRLTDFKRGKPTGATALTLASGRKLLVLPETHEHRVTMFDVTGLADDFGSEPPIAARFGTFGHGDGEMVFPTDVAFRRSGAGAIDRVWVSEYGGNDRVSIWDARDPADVSAGFVFVRAFGTFGQGEGEPVEFNRPQALHFDGARNELIIVDACNHRVGRFTPDGGLIAWIGGAGLRYPFGLAWAGGSEYLVAEFEASRITRIDLDRGEVISRTGRMGRGEGELASPWGVAVSAGRVFALDSGNNRVQVFPAGSTAGGAR